VNKNPFALVQYNDGTGYKKGLLLLRDGSIIESGYLSNVGNTTVNSLTTSQYEYLLSKGCLIISYTGNYTGSKWREPSGYYGAVNLWTTDEFIIDCSQYGMGADNNISTVGNDSVVSNGSTPVRLVKKL
jgi:hypothetical protein